MGPGVEIVLICVLIVRSGHDLGAFNQRSDSSQPFECNELTFL